MKKALILSFFIFAAFSFVACKKERTCECTTNGQTTTITLIDVTKRQAKSNCFSYSNVNNGQTVKTDCKLK